MKIIERHEPVTPTKRLTCDKCSSVFEFEKIECNVTDQLAVMHDGLGGYNIKCPVCCMKLYFDWK